MAEMLEARLAAAGAVEREQWCLDNWDMVAAEVAAAQNVSLGVAANQLIIADDLRHRLPRVAEVFATGVISYRIVAAVAARTRLMTDPEVMAKVDTEIAAQVVGWGSLSVAKTETAIDYWVDRYDPAAVRHTERRARGRHVTVTDPGDGSGLVALEALLYAADGDAIDKRLDAMSATVCDADPRNRDQRRSDALAAIMNGQPQLACRCGAPDCEAAERRAANVVVHIVANEDALTDTTPIRLDGPPRDDAANASDAPDASESSDASVTHADPDPSESPDAPSADAKSDTPPPSAPRRRGGPALIIGGALLPAPLVAATLAQTAMIERIVHPGDAPPEPRYRPSKELAAFIRCRDLTCRCPGCDVPADRCDLDHTIPYPYGPTQASNIKALCRTGHLLKTFCGWHDEQLPDGTVIWTTPDGHTYTTHPGSRLLFPTLCKPTAPVILTGTPPAPHPGREANMPRRHRTRQQARRDAITAERALNLQHLIANGRTQLDPTAEEQPPPF
jgi:hypothetical protein